MERKLGSSWTHEDLTKAMDSVLKDKVSVRYAAITYGIPRRTLRNHLLSGSHQKIKGRKPTLSIDQELELCNRILRLSDVGMPLTPNVLKRTVFSFCELNGVAHPFNPNKFAAGKKWLKLFLCRHPIISRRKSQNLNPARAQKLNRFIVNDHFEKLKTVMLEIGLMDKPQSIYNIDEKGNRLCLHKAQTVLAKRGARRVHNVASEHGENCTIVACVNALGHAVPPVILYKGNRLKPEWTENLPPGAQVLMTAKASMTAQTFIKWLDHFAKYKTPGPVLLIFDGASSHLDANIVHAAEAHEITLYCLPSNTTHELQPLDKSVFKSYEMNWDNEVVLFWTQRGHGNDTTVEDVSTNRLIKRYQFGSIFSRAWAKAVTPSNICSGFKATGIYPFDPTAIPDEAFAPSVLTFQPHRLAGDNTNNDNEEPQPLKQPDNTGKTTTSRKTHLVPSDICGKKKKKVSSKNQEHDSETSLSDSQSYSEHDSTTDEIDVTDNSEVEQSQTSPSISDILRTPNFKKQTNINATGRRKALNYRGQKIVASLFQDSSAEPKKKRRLT